MKAFRQFCSDTCPKCPRLTGSSPVDNETGLQASLHWMPSVTCSAIAAVGMCDHCRLSHPEYLATVAKPAWTAFNLLKESGTLSLIKSADISWSQTYQILHRYATLNRARLLYDYTSYYGTLISSSKNELTECATSWALPRLFSDLLCRGGTNQNSARPCCTPAMFPPYKPPPKESVQSSFCPPFHYDETFKGYTIWIPGAQMPWI